MTMLIMAILMMSGCGITSPKFYPVVPKLHKIKGCGRFKWEKKNGKLILDYKKAQCLYINMRRCAEDRAKLIEANKANVGQMKKASQNHLKTSLR